MWVSRLLLLIVASGQAAMPCVSPLVFKPFQVCTFSALFSRLFLDNDIFCQRLKSLTVWLDDRDGKMDGFAGVDVSYGAAFTLVDAADDFAFGTVFQLAWLSGFHSCSLFGMDCRLRPILIRIAQLPMIERPNGLQATRLAISRCIDREFELLDVFLRVLTLCKINQIHAATVTSLSTVSELVTWFSQV